MLLGRGRGRQLVGGWARVSGSPPAHTLVGITAHTVASSFVCCAATRGPPTRKSSVASRFVCELPLSLLGPVDAQAR